MARVRVPAIWSVMLLLAAACSGGSSDPSEESAPSSGAFSITDALQADGPLRGVAFTGHVDREDPEVRPTLAFTTADTEVTAVIGLGDVGEGSTLVVTWYRVAGPDEREALFSHEIAVGPGGLAFSQAVAPNGLAPGIYDTAATMDGNVVHTPWVVREAGASEIGATAQAASGDESSNGPYPGDSSFYDGVGPPPAQGPPLYTCRLDSIDAGMSPMTDITASAWWLGPCSTGTLTATVSGPPQTLASSDSLEVPVGKLYGQTDVCGLSGGSDLPGTVVHLEVTGSATGAEDFTLPDFGESLTAGIEGVPEAGAKVQAGDRIDLIALAMVMPPALGVKTLYVDDGSDLLESVGNLSGSDEPAKCDPRRVVAGLRTQYRVPDDPPPVIELCATGVGFDGTESKNCIRYYTGEVWKGTANIASSVVYPGVDRETCRDGWELEFTFGVGSEGTINGQGTAELTSAPTCTPYPIAGPSWEHVEIQVMGEEAAGGFSLRFAYSSFEPAGTSTNAGFTSMFGGGGLPYVGSPVVVAVSGTSGTGQGMWQVQSGNPPATYSANGTITIECVSCEEAVG